MDIEIYNAFIKAGVGDIEARAAVESISKEIDRRYTMHSTQIFSKADGVALEVKIAEMKTEIIKWCIGTMFGAVALFATLMKLWN